MRRHTAWVRTSYTRHWTTSRTDNRRSQYNIATSSDTQYGDDVGNTAEENSSVFSVKPWLHVQFIACDFAAIVAGVLK